MTAALRARALRHLGRREFGRVELGQRLRAADGADAVAIEQVLTDLEQSGQLSDRRAAESWVRANAPRFGTQRIVHQLRLRGIADEYVESALATLDTDDVTRARMVWLKKFGIAPNTSQERAKQARFLQSRGFSGETIRRLLRDPESTD